MAIMPQDQEVRLSTIMPIEIKGVRINTGDMVYGDRDGILIVPKEVVDELLVWQSKKQGENNW